MKKILIGYFASFELLFGNFVWADFSVPDFELVYTAPAETTLLQEDVRGPVAVWTEMFDQAKKTIDLGQFYIAWKAGEPIEPVVQALERAGKRGVKIRCLFEKKMIKQSEEGIGVLRKIPNLEVRVIDFGKVNADGIVHAKYIVVDGKTAFVGSQNFDWRSLKHIAETGLKTSNAKIAGQIQKIFDADWSAQALAEKSKTVAALQKIRPDAETSASAYLVASPWKLNPAGVGDSESELVRLIGDAKTEVLVQVMNYYPLDHRKKKFYPVIDNALRAAAARGVKIKLLVSDWNNDKPAIDHVKSLSLLPNVEVKIVSIPQIKDAFVPFGRVAHSKYMIVDGKTSWVGTSNWTGGYFDHSRNLELVVKDEKLASKLKALHSQAWDSTYSAKLDVNQDYPKVRRE